MISKMMKRMVAVVAIVVMTLGVVMAQSNNTPQGYYILSDIPAGWTVTADGQPVEVNANGEALIQEGAQVVVIPSDRDKPRVKSVSIVPSGPVVSVEKQWLLTYDYDNGSTEVLLYDFGATYTNIVAYRYLEGDEDLDVNLFFQDGYTITQLPGGRYKVSSSHSSFFFMFSDLTESTAKFQVYYYDDPQDSHFTQDEYGWGKTAHDAVAVSGYEMPWETIALKVGGNDYFMTEGITDAFASYFSAFDWLRNSILNGQQSATVQAFFLNAPGEEADFQSVDVSGKIVVLPRGSITFETKMLNARAAGAIAVVCANNEEGTVNAALGASHDFDFPFFVAVKGVYDYAGFGTGSWTSHEGEITFSIATNPTQVNMGY